MYNDYYGSSQGVGKSKNKIHQPGTPISLTGKIPI